MAKSKNLKAFLASSLNEIFKATVNDILDSVEETLSEYHEKIRRIEAENESLRQSLQGREDVTLNGGDKNEAEEEENKCIRGPMEMSSILSKHSRGKLKYEPVKRQLGDCKQVLEGHHKCRLQEPSGITFMTKRGSTSGLLAPEAAAGAGDIKKAPYHLASDLGQDFAMDLSTANPPPSLQAKKIKSEMDAEEFTDPERCVSAEALHSLDLKSGDGDCGTLLQVQLLRLTVAHLWST
ncbi:hypothetical protein GJAV_G00028910 [Gymnothorax javanicus]|nr:hypothetical protein GJAV_G00028910 [Gymnothorax javanicus]